MGTQLQTPFIAWALSEDEIIQGNILNEHQYRLTQNDLANVANQLISLSFDSRDVMKFAQEQSYLMGQKELLQTKLDAHSAALQALASTNQANRN